MKRLIFATVMAVLFFTLLNFVYCNLDDATFAYPVVFKFRIPVILSDGFRSIPLPLGFVLLLAFCFGMVAIALLEALPSLYKTLELRAKNKKIRELERELSISRQLAGIDKTTNPKS
ncbi:MAG: hypothetical protein A2W61_00905 [Deltaproteobacteria bacterium RIFCSPLOWO2_01_44_7]|nr:MAG: hypothetical protein A2712_06510 [Deltaproteobacteria bacterium RIFCSPHIGHO2_01_FULL_43_49]OGQ15607.1 MAG: hypothetical protein A3D22_05300 [Deltaproteobacteria bacterium RIFCSPHIGHO2_02_FULL_44_53]OGQ28310.1 MAG: hypothetical protein A3D98_00965 [Deltaproteobacteria bacterium RIFCSPHIGHO2_12_FULL_44_21]OGQ31897.1 MAG: hypothetical protein A2979_02240 [Deltaproteobacteria bacterium RIFCSPLOWO2_01_FULL_45_74]OGQ38270.1 MAG: hypothetical protein A2W61_00905 [Deltaproteobacteria bacterium 